MGVVYTDYVNVTPMGDRRCSVCGVPIEQIELRHGNVTWRYPCLCAKDPGEHWLVRLWHNTFDEDDDEG